MITDHEDARRTQDPDDRETDEEIRDRADAAAHRADHDNKCAREASEGIELSTD